MAEDVRIMQDSTGMWFWVAIPLNGEGASVVADRFATREAALEAAKAAGVVEEGAEADVWMDGVTAGSGSVPMPAVDRAATK